MTKYFSLIMLIIGILMIIYYAFIDQTPKTYSDDYQNSSWCSGIYCD